MKELVEIKLLPLGKVLRLARGIPLQDALFAQGVEFPCGGRGRCKGCRFKVLEGSLAIHEADKHRLNARELAEGWRLACCARAEGDLSLELAQWEAAILTDDSEFAFTPRPGLGIAIDLGTTTLAAQLLDLQSGRVLGVRTALNSQAKHGADIMSRVEFALAGEGQQILQTLVREQIGELVGDLMSANSNRANSPLPARAAEPTATPEQTVPSVLKHVVLVGNTVMHHLFCGLSLEPLSHYPFEPHSPGLQLFTAGEMGWQLTDAPGVRFLPCLGGFVGSDILAGLLATRMHEADELQVLIDLGTNGEIVVGNRERLLCASTAAGPAFEGARISMGMRAATGAIAEVRVNDGELQCHVLGNVAPRGICGSGLVDAVAAGLELGRLRSNGRLAKGESLVVASPVCISQWDVRELQLAKGAIAAGLRLLLEQWGAGSDDLARVHLAGAFGNYINYASAQRIGLFKVAPEKVKPAGNTALLGAKLALFNLDQQDGSYPEILNKVRHVSLNEDTAFQQVYVEEMGFP
jgi:uncharacterized 2Fe-2S/4Fe-4S cluster protein (DUF4445 family)